MTRLKKFTDKLKWVFNKEWKIEIVEAFGDFLILEEIYHGSRKRKLVYKRVRPDP